jgi:hypothetical protein
MYNLLDPAQYPWGQPTAGLKKLEQQWELSNLPIEAEPPGGPRATRCQHVLMRSLGYRMIKYMVMYGYT